MGIITDMKGTGEFQGGIINLKGSQCFTDSPVLII